MGRRRFPIRIGTPVIAAWPPKTAKPKLMFCPHERLLCEREVTEYEVWVKENPSSTPNVEECPRCNPTCAHEFRALTDSEIFSGKRWSAACPKCNPAGVTDPAVWQAFLKHWGYSPFRGMSPVEHVWEHSDGRVELFGHGRNYRTGRGSADLEEVDARRRHDSQKSCATSPKGYGAVDEQVHVRGTCTPGGETPRPAEFDGKLKGMEKLALTKADTAILTGIREEIVANDIPMELEKTRQND